MASVKHNTVFVAVGQVLRIVMAFMLLPVASRVLGDESFGRYNLATTIMFFVMLVDDFGLNMWVTREIARFRDRAQRYFAYTAGLKFSLILASFLFVAVLVRVSPYDRETVHAIWIFAIYAVLISFRDLGIAIFRAYEMMVWETIVLSLERVLITSIGIFVLLSGGGLVGLSWAFVASAVISLFVSAWIIVKKFLHLKIAFSLKEFLPMFKGASVFGVSMFLTTMYSRIDMIMLSLMKSPDVWGWYAAAHKLIDFTNVVPNILMIATFPTLARFSVSMQDQLSALFTRGFKYLLILAIPLIPGIILLSHPIILLINGEEFINAVPALRVLSFTAAILFINIFAAGLYGATNNQGKLVVIQIVGLVLNASLNYLLIPGYAHVGAAVSTVITESTVMVVTLVYVFKKIVRLQEKRFIADAVVAALVMTTVLWFLRNLNLFAIVFAGVFVYFGVLFLFKTISVKELLSFKRSPN